MKRVEDSPERYRDYSAGLRAEWEITGCDFLDVSYAFDQYDKSDFHKLADMDVRSYSNVQNSLRALYNHTFGNDNVLTAGADVMRDYLRNTKLADPVRSQVSTDAFVQYDHTFFDKWEVVGALRYDYFSDGNLSRVTPKVSARFRPRYDITLRAGYGMGFRAPTLKEKYYDFDMAKKRYAGKALASFFLVLFTMPLGHAAMILMEHYMEPGPLHLCAFLLGFAGLLITVTGVFVKGDLKQTLFGFIGVR